LLFRWCRPPPYNNNWALLRLRCAPGVSMTSSCGRLLPSTGSYWCPK
jgi:hypothetical protein